MRTLVAVCTFAVIYIAIRIVAVWLWGIDPDIGESAVVMVAFAAGNLGLQVVRQS